MRQWSPYYEQSSLIHTFSALHDLDRLTFFKINHAGLYPDAEIHLNFGGKILLLTPFVLKRTENMHPAPQRYNNLGKIGILPSLIVPILKKEICGW
jgi:hypothetical protein